MAEMTETVEDKRMEVLRKLLDEGLQPGSLTLDEAKLLLDSHSDWIVDNIEAWPDDLHPTLAQMIADKGNQWLFSRIEKFKGANQKQLAIQLLQSGVRGFLTVTSAYDGGPPKPFDWLDQDVAIAMIEAGEGLPVRNFPHIFKNLDPKEIVWAMAKKCPDFIEGFMRNLERGPVAQ